MINENEYLLTNSKSFYALFAWESALRIISNQFDHRQTSCIAFSNDKHVLEKVNTVDTYWQHTVLHRGRQRPHPSSCYDPAVQFYVSEIPSQISNFYILRFSVWMRSAQDWESLRDQGEAYVQQRMHISWNESILYNNIIWPVIII